MLERAAKPRIPILDLRKQYEQIADAMEQSVLSVLRSGHYILGKYVTDLEATIAKICGCDHAVGVANGTDALILALWALDIGPGDEVITPSFTFAATAEAIAIRGAKPVFVDIDPVTFNISPELVERAITPRTKAILPVHLYGQPADMGSIMEIARSRGIKVVEDNAQAIGALYKGRPTGCMGDVACISFYPTKNLGAAGDAGMLVTRHAAVADRLRVLRAHGSRQRYYHEELGVNSRLDEIQAAVLLSKTPYLAAWNEKRRQVAALYDTMLSGCSGIITPQVTAGNTAVWHQYTIRVTRDAGVNRDTMKARLSDLGIDSMIYYPVPLHTQQAFAGYGYRKGDLTISETVAEEVLSLPMYPELSEEQIRYITDSIKSIVQEASALVVPSAVQVSALPTG